MALNLDNIDLDTARSAELPWTNSEINEETGEIKIYPIVSFNVADFNDWCVKNLNSDQLQTLNQVSDRIKELKQEAIDEGDLVIDEGGNNIWSDKESFSILFTLIDPDSIATYHKIHYAYGKDKGLID